MTQVLDMWYFATTTPYGVRALVHQLWRILCLGLIRPDEMAFDLLILK